LCGDFVKAPPGGNYRDDMPKRFSGAMAIRVRTGARTGSRPCGIPPARGRGVVAESLTGEVGLTEHMS
jgi:hypothetical protein